MAIFEKTSQTKVTVDDTDKLICYVENAYNVDKHTEYNLRVQRGPLKKNNWNVSRRYKDFAALHSDLQQSNIYLPLPPKKLIGNMQPSFVAERQIALQHYVNEVLKYPKLSLSLPVRRFFDPNNYLLNLPEQALQTVSIALRGDGNFELKGPMNDIGWRIRKKYFLVTDSEKRTNCVLSWQNHGVDKYLEDKDVQISLKSLQNISHPYIDNILAVHNLENGAYVIRRLHENGSIRDMLYGTEYNKSHLAKYSNPKIRRPFTSGQIAHYGLQILQALKFLNEKNVPHGHLHPGNIAIENQKALLMDIENNLLGAPSLYRPYILEHKRICTMESIDVYSFGHTIYEMAFAEPLEKSNCDNFPEGVPNELEIILKLCLSSTSCKHGMPSLDHLMQHSFFMHTHSFTNGLASREQHCRQHLKFPMALKDELKKAITAIENRLRSDQKLVKYTKREVRIQEILSSDEEMKKQRRRMKKRENTWKSTSSLTETVHSHSMSSASSPTPPILPEQSNSSSQSVTPAAISPPPVGRQALLSAICSFNKNKLTPVKTQ